jgi:CBS domain-containing protein
MTRVADVMSSPPIACPGDATIGEVAALLVERRIHGVAVLDGARPAGVLSDTDLLAGEWLATDPDTLAVMRSMRASELMSAPPVTIDADADAAEAAARLCDLRLARLLVTGPDGLAGVISTSDLVELLARGPVGRGAVADVMSRGIVVCREGTTAAQAARAMSERRVRALTVVAAQGRPLGIVTGRDLLPLVGGGASATVDELMHEPLTIEPGATLREAADRMLQHGIHRLVVVDPATPDAMPLGIVSTADVVAAMAAPGSVWT